MKKDYRCGTIALLGPTNAGKSSLLNAFLGEKISIVTPKVNTTRSQITGIYTDDNAQMIFLDTPGFQTHTGVLQKAMSQSILQSQLVADCYILVLDISLYIERPAFLKNDLEQIKEQVNATQQPAIIVLNKIDLFADKTKMLPFIDELHTIFPQAEIFPCSTLDSKAIEQLRDLIYNVLPVSEAIFPSEQTSTLSVQYLAQEMIREQLFLLLDKEVPYATAVQIHDWQEDDKKAVIYATILIARDSQKSIIIGKGGKIIKAIGAAARKNIVELLGKKVYLDLWVKVQNEWYDNIHILQELGIYGSCEL